MVKRLAMIFGIVFILVAVLGFMSTGMSNMDADPATAPKILGMFPVNVLHNVVHLLFGVWGLIAARTFAGAKSYCTIGGAIYLLLAVIGFVSPTTFGLIPIGGNDIWLHAVLGIALLAAGLTAKDDAPVTAAAM
jgi:hypothetical protein